MKRTYFGIAVVLLFAALPIFADSVAAHWLQPNVKSRVYPEPPLHSAPGASSVSASLEPTSADDLAEMREWNAAGRAPMKVGIERRLEKPLVSGGGPRATSTETYRWRASISVKGSTRLRAKLTGLRATSDSVFWVYGETGEARGFDGSLANDGTLWTPSVAGGTITIEVQSPGSAPASFTITSISDIHDDVDVQPNGEQCIQDMTCYSGVEDLQTTIGHMLYQSGSSAYVCSGGLIADIDLTGTPYFITANHCISTPAEAASLETYWDYKTAVCGGPDPGRNSARRVNGSTLVSTTETQDLSLLRLSSLPGGTRYFLGWTSTRPAVGTTLYRISHPHGQPQRFSTSTIENTSNECVDASRSNYIYSKPVVGTVVPGSSGSPTFNDDAQIVGALSAGCPGSADPCGPSIRTIDGAFSTAYNTVFKPYLNPGSPIGNPCSACAANANTACMLNGRFKVTLTWRDPSANLSGNGRLINYSENRPITDPANGEVSQVTFWSMYPNDTTSVEALVRMIRGGSSFWIFTTGFAAAEYTVTVQDTKNCTTWQRTSPFGSTAKIADYNALPF